MLTPVSNALKDKEETFSHLKSPLHHLLCQCLIDEMKDHVVQQNCNCHFLALLAVIQAPVQGILGVYTHMFSVGSNWD